MSDLGDLAPEDTKLVTLARATRARFSITAVPSSPTR